MKSGQEFAMVFVFVIFPFAELCQMAIGSSLMVVWFFFACIVTTVSIPDNFSHGPAFEKHVKKLEQTCFLSKVKREKIEKKPSSNFTPFKVMYDDEKNFMVVVELIWWHVFFSLTIFFLPEGASVLTVLLTVFVFAECATPVLFVRGFSPTKFAESVELISNIVDTIGPDAPVPDTLDYVICYVRRHKNSETFQRLNTSLDVIEEGIKKAEKKRKKEERARELERERKIKLATEEEKMRGVVKKFLRESYSSTESAIKNLFKYYEDAEGGGGKK